MFELEYFNLLVILCFVEGEFISIFYVVSYLLSLEDIRDLFLIIVFFYLLCGCRGFNWVLVIVVSILLC